MVVNGEENTIIYSNVLVGEVWVSSGQSNMDWPLSLTENALKEILQSYYPRVRIFNVRKNAKKNKYYTDFLCVNVLWGIFKRYSCKSTSAGWL